MTPRTTLPAAAVADATATADATDLTADLTAAEALARLLTPEAVALLDNPIWAALTGPHAHLAERLGDAARYPVDVSPFTALADPADPQGWRDLAALAGPPGTALPVTATAPDDWEVVEAGQGVQLIATALRTEPAPEAVLLGLADVPEMLDLVARTKPGPFLPRTVLLGRYLGLREEGRLIAMAGERMRLPGWTEISAVCTDPDHRGRGLATRLVRAVAHGIEQRGDRPFLHAAASNTKAIALYESLGFTLRRRTEFTVVRTPVTVADGGADDVANGGANGGADGGARP
ncbi:MULTISPECIES: GNAT family N-acetyltransferase [Kitasatospora]|uniref:Putative acetyltransferase n=1 Tax=Kitasatospora setae (strain ATCC 33774 / DSM 43861 / JCM 3304 / KCC A-0304 / NBRC 14216 / KM-6054) TaxID=452652 RepID=E4MYU3_KITSK|nr:MULTISPECIES: GNAT family N-acetyltransferase [Kitasatospora]BAJ32776.1 putative acetyltransferase [Kitasatospora setae KM-6054]